MKLLHILPFAILITGCDHGDNGNDPELFNPEHLARQWHYTQRVSEGEITVYSEADPCGRPYLTLFKDHTYLKTSLNSCAAYIESGTWQRENNILHLNSSHNTIAADIEIVNKNTLTLQTYIDTDGDGIKNSVRESFTSK